MPENIDIYIGDVASTIRATDSEVLLSPQLLRQLVAAVLDQLRQQAAYEERRLRERRLAHGVAEDQRGGSQWR